MTSPTRALLLLCVGVLCNVLCQATNDVEETAAKSGLRNKRTASKVAELREKLASLENLLNDYEKNSPAKETPPPPTTPAAVEKHEQKSNSAEETLSKKDVLLLRSLVAAAHSLGEGKQSQASVPGSEEPVDKSKIISKVVYRLLSDLDLALKHGISVEDIIEYLYHMEVAARDRQQRDRIEDEESQLKALLNQEPAPRD